MVESLEIKEKYNQLLDLIKIEASFSPSICDYLNYMNVYKEHFVSDSNFQHKEDLKEFLRAANRYFDEFVVSDEQYSKVKELINNLFEILGDGKSS